MSVQKFQIKKDGSLNTFFLASSSVIVVPTGNLRNFTAHRRRQRFKKERVLELMATVGFQVFFSDHSEQLLAPDRCISLPLVRK